MTQEKRRERNDDLKRCRRVEGGRGEEKTRDNKRIYESKNREKSEQRERGSEDIKRS